MGLFRILLGIWAGWIAVRVLRHFFFAQLSRPVAEAPIKSNGKTLELVPCPYCGVFTTTPCTNPDCPGKR